MNEKYVPFGGDKHIVRADVRLCGYTCGMFTSVVFRTPAELDSLIASLTALRDGWDHPIGHIHLQDYVLAPGLEPTHAEVIFLTPAWADTEFEKETRERLIEEAHEQLVK